MKCIIRQVDGLGRIVLPMSYRKKLGLFNGSKISIYCENGTICIVPEHDICALCGCNSSVNKKLRLCKQCIQLIKESE